MHMKLPKRGEVWIETVTPKFTNSNSENWVRLHFVLDIKTVWLAGNQHKYVFTRSKNEVEVNQIDLVNFLKFENSGFSIDVSIPCVEQLTLENLKQIADGIYKLPIDREKAKDSVDLAFQLIETLEAVEIVGGFHRKRQIELAIIELRNVALFLGQDVASLDREMYFCGIRF